jgi:hypothetical protein
VEPARLPSLDVVPTQLPPPKLLIQKGAAIGDMATVGFPLTSQDATFVLIGADHMESPIVSDSKVSFIIDFLIKSCLFIIRLNYALKKVIQTCGVDAGATFQAIQAYHTVLASQ